MSVGLFCFYRRLNITEDLVDYLMLDLLGFYHGNLGGSLEL